MSSGRSRSTPKSSASPKASRYEEEGKILVGQVNREDCEILLNCQQPEKTGRGRIFISIDIGPLRALRAEFEGRGAPIRDGWWGYDTMIIEDPDGNQLFFPYPNKESRLIPLCLFRHEIIFFTKQPKNRMSSPKPPNSHKPNKMSWHVS